MACTLDAPCGGQVRFDSLHALASGGQWGVDQVGQRTVVGGQGLWRCVGGGHTVYVEPFPDAAVVERRDETPELDDPPVEEEEAWATATFRRRGVWHRERIKAFVRAYNAGMPLAEMAREFSIAPGSVCGFASEFRQAGYPVRRFGRGRHRDNPLDQAPQRSQRIQLENALKQCDGNRAHAATLLGLSRTRVRALIEKFGIQVPRVSPRQTPHWNDGIAKSSMAAYAHD